MQKWISPFRMRGRKKSLCSCEPNSMMVGPTVLMVSMGTGAPARMDSSKKTNCSTAVKPRPPYSLGQPTPSQPSSPIFLTIFLCAGPTPWLLASSSSTSGVSSSE